MRMICDDRYKYVEVYGQKSVFFDLISDPKEFKNEIQEGKINEVLIENNLSIIAVVGEDLRQTPGITGKVFDALGSRNINANAIAQGSSMLNL